MHMNDFSRMDAAALIQGAHACACGRAHETGLKILDIGAGAVARLPQALISLGAKKPFIVCDENTKQAALAGVRAALDGAGMPYTVFCMRGGRIEPDEHAVGACAMAFDPSCDIVLAVGSGVVNDCCKVLAHAAGMKSAVVATAPSMDGYASDSSSMVQNRVKVSLYNACPSAIIADTDIVKNAPMRMLQAGLGDMLAKYVSLCEWRISHLVTGEYYCENIAGLVRASLKKVTDAAPGVASRDARAAEAMTQGLVLSGVAMSFARISRPASGLEHYFSHIWEMMALQRGEKSELHGIQVGVGTLLTLRLYERIKTIKPDRAKAEAFIASFTDEKWQAQTRGIFGDAAQTVIDDEHQKNHNNDPLAHKARLDNIIAHWDDIQAIIRKELPDVSVVEQIMQSAGMPLTPADIGVSQRDTVSAFLGSRDIRAKYLTSSMLWDLGLLYDFVPLVEEYAQ